MKTYGVVLIGCGHIGSEHIEDIYYRENIRIVAVIDKNRELALEFQKKYGAAYADTDYVPYLQKAETDIVIIATPASLHLAMLKDCLKFHKHVLCEKPIAVSEKDGEEFYRLCKAADVCVSVGHILRFNDTFIKVKELIDSGVIGNLKTVRMVQNQHIVNMPRYHELLKNCSTLLDCGVHYYDLIQWISGGRITAVNGFSTLISDEFDDVKTDYGIVNLFLDNGVTGYYEAGWSRSINSSNVKEFIGDKGGITVTLKRFRSEHTEEGDLIEIYQNDSREYKTVNVRCDYKPMYRQLSALIDSIEGRPSSMPDIDDVYYAFKVGIAADRATAARQTVNIK